jgi:argininosuccinate lyase
MAKIWQTSKSCKMNPLVESFLSGEDVGLDQKLVVYDITGSLAHSKMLFSIGLLTKKEQQQIAKGLNQIKKLYHQGKFVVTVADEDVHAAVETKLIELIGDAGNKLHTGRSRNDQVLTDLCLYCKDQLQLVEKLAKDLVKVFHKWGKKYAAVPMPGYTHMQKDMPTSVFTWIDSYGETLTNDLLLLKAAYQLADQNPLGSGAGFGVNLPLDKQLTARLLGFAKVQHNPIACQHLRGKLELAVLAAMGQIMITLSKLAQDLLLFTTQEFDFFQVDESLTTGSSIMPQKKNLDVAELIRAKAHVVGGYTAMVAGICAGLPMGFNRDMQETKGPMMQGLKTTKDSLSVTKVLITGIKPKASNLKAAMTADLYATDKAYELVKKGVPFRKAYQQIKQEIYEN